MGTITNSGTITNNGSITSSGTIENAKTITIAAGKTIENTGTIKFTHADGAINGASNTTSVLDNKATGVVEIGTGLTCTSAFGAKLTFKNAGELKMTGAGTLASKYVQSGSGKITTISNLTVTDPAVGTVAYGKITGTTNSSALATALKAALDKFKTTTVGVTNSPDCTAGVWGYSKFASGNYTVVYTLSDGKSYSAGKISSGSEITIYESMDQIGSTGKNAIGLDETTWTTATLDKLTDIYVIPAANINEEKGANVTTSMTETNVSAAVAHFDFSAAE